MRLSEKILIEELTQAGAQLQGALKGLSIGALIAMIRKQFRMSQRVLARRAKVPQSTISHLERSKKEPHLATLRKVLNALYSDFLIVPVLKESIDTLRRKEAQNKAIKRVKYLLGSMHLENQAPDIHIVQELIKKESEELLRSSKLWEEDEEV